MDAFADITPLWDLSQATTFSQLADDDFLALLQKQFPATTSPTLNLASDFATGSVDPNDMSRFALPSFNPPSEDSSPSPQQDTDSRGVLKRKASIDDDDDTEEGPSSKAQHTSASNKKNGARRKSGGGPDESRLLKRKEQNRAAQRAFRERKEKHVKDLEDKVAALEARNEQTTSENTNLRDLLQRLQSENLALKQGSFTFQVPKNGNASSSSSSSLSPPESNVSPSFSRNSPQPKYTNPLDLSSLTAFDPSVLDLLDEPTATSSSMDFNGFNREGGFLANHFTTIASNPAFFSLASMFDPTPVASPPPTASASPPFDFSNMQSWATPSDSAGTLDDLFGGYLSGGLSDMSMLGTGASPSPTVSPIMHQPATSAANSHSPSNSTSSGESPMFGTPRDGMSSSSESENGDGCGGATDQCPKNKKEYRERVAYEGMSSFVTSPLLKKDNSPFGMVTCQGTSSFPKTPKNDDNIEVLSAWRSITSNPNFKDCDINELCTEFSNKARCDGTKVVLEPAGVNSILSHLSQAKTRT